MPLKHKPPFKQSGGAEHLNLDLGFKNCTLGDVGLLSVSLLDSCALDDDGWARTGVDGIIVEVDISSKGAGVVVVEVAATEMVVIVVVVEFALLFDLPLSWNGAVVVLVAVLAVEVLRSVVTVVELS